MKQKILIKRINKSIDLPQIIRKGDWIDLRASQTVRFKAPQAGTLKTRTVDGKEEKYRNVTFDLQVIPLGVAIRLPDGYEALVVARSSLPGGFGLFVGNSMGVIDGVTTPDSIGYNGNNDEWKTPLVALRDTTVTEGERICQFRIQLSQKASAWQKIKWLFSSGVKLEFVESLGNPDRGGHSSTGVK